MAGPRAGSSSPGGGRPPAIAAQAAADASGEPPRPPASGACGVLIPAYNEAATIASVVGCALAAQLGPVLVVDDASRDDTARAAREAGAEVLRLPRNLGKGGAVYVGAAALETEVVLLIDADLVGLRPAHLLELSRPVLKGEAEMSRGVFVGGRWRTAAAQHLAPQLSGQRALRRDLLLSVPGLATSRYGVEIIITTEAKRRGWRSVDVPLAGVSQVMKEEKLGFFRGLVKRLAMYRDIVTSYVGRRR